MSDLDETMKAVVAKAMFEALEPQKRDALVQEALKSLLKSEKAPSYPYTERPSELQRLFEQECARVAATLVKEHIQTSESLKVAIQQIAIKATESLLSGEIADLLAAGVGKVIGEAVHKVKYD